MTDPNLAAVTLSRYSHRRSPLVLLNLPEGSVRWTGSWIICLFHTNSCILPPRGRAASSCFVFRIEGFPRSPGEVLEECFAHSLTFPGCNSDFAPPRGREGVSTLSRGELRRRQMCSVADEAGFFVLCPRSWLSGYLAGCDALPPSPILGR